MGCGGSKESQTEEDEAAAVNLPGAVRKKEVMFKTRHTEIDFEQNSSVEYDSEFQRPEGFETFVLKLAGKEDEVKKAEEHREFKIENQLKKILKRIRAAAGRARDRVTQRATGRNFDEDEDYDGGGGKRGKGKGKGKGGGKGGKGKVKGGGKGGKGKKKGKGVGENISLE